MNDNSIEKRNEILHNWTKEEGSSMDTVYTIHIIQSMIDENKQLKKMNKRKICRLYRGQLVDKNLVQKKNNVTLINNKLSSWTKSLLSASIYSRPNGYQGAGINKIPFVFSTKYDFKQKLGLDLECLKNYDYYPDVPKKMLRKGRMELSGNEDDDCQCYHESFVIDKDREVIIYNSEFDLDLNSLKLSFTNAFDEEIQLSMSAKKILKSIADESIFKNESWFKFIGFKSLIFFPQQIPEIREKLVDKGMTDVMIDNLNMYIRCTVNISNI